MTNKQLYQIALKDFYGNSYFREDVLLNYLLKRNRSEITEEEKENLWSIENNIKDEIYKAEILLIAN